MMYNWWLMNQFFVVGRIYTIIPMASALGFISFILTSIVAVLGVVVFIEKSVTKFIARGSVKGSLETVWTSTRNQRGILAIGLVMVSICGLYVGTTIQNYPRLV